MIVNKKNKTMLCLKKNQPVEARHIHRNKHFKTKDSYNIHLLRESPPEGLSNVTLAGKKNL